MNKRILVALGMAASVALTACSSDAESGSGSSDNQVEASENADGDGGDSSRSGIRGINVDEDSSVKVDDRYEGRFNEYLQETTPLAHLNSTACHTEAGSSSMTLQIN